MPPEHLHVDLLQKKIMLAVVEVEAEVTAIVVVRMIAVAMEEATTTRAMRMMEEVPQCVGERGSGSVAVVRLEGGGDIDGTEDHTSSQQKLPSTIPLHLDSVIAMPASNKMRTAPQTSTYKSGPKSKL